MLKFITDKIFGSQNNRELKRISKIVERINALEPDIVCLSDEQLRHKTVEFKDKIKKELEARNYNQLEKREQKKILQGVLNEILVEAFAVVRESAKRTINMRHFDVQLIGGIVLHEGKIAEMATGEGKTLVATLSAYLNSLTGDGVHIVTVNDYLAKRDREWMRPIYEFLGLSVGVIQHDMSPIERQKMYACDIVYGTNNEFGFDYLRDNMANSLEEVVQKKLHYAIVDEVDSILIDEARTPLIISGPAEESTEKYYIIDRIIPKLKGRIILEKDQIEAKYKGEDISKGYDYIVDEKNHTVSLTEQGITKCEEILGIKSLYDDISGEWAHHITQAIRAHTLFKKDVDYVVKDGQVIIVDEFTGRLMPGRRWSDGLHQAIEAKESIKIEMENQTLATITLQNYFRMYEKLAGMTGTAFTEAIEFKAIYDLDVVVIPTNKPLRRTNFPDLIYKTEKEKFDAVVEEIVDLYNKGRPVLVGTISIEKSERLSAMLKRRGIPHNVLNAKYHEREAHIIAQAGKYKAVTIATNMAGRGTDIILGGNPEFMAKNMALAKGLDPASPEYLQEFKNLYQQLKKQADEEHNTVVELGGLHVLGTERHEARRIDNQLRGRAGRQGDPGSSRFYVSFEDDLMRLFAPDWIIRILEPIDTQGQPLTAREGKLANMLSKSIETAQKRIEAYNFEIRKQLLEYDDVMNQQREIIYSQRRMVLENSDIKEWVIDMIKDVFEQGINAYIHTNNNPEMWDVVGLKNWLYSKFSPLIKIDERSLLNTNDMQAAKDLLLEQILDLYEQKERSLGSEQMRHLERMIVLHSVDLRWKDHLYSIDVLKEGIGLRAYGQRDPLIEYKNEAYLMFQDMTNRIKEEVVQFLFRVQAPAEKKIQAVFSSLPKELVHNEFSGLKKKNLLQQQEAVQDGAEQSSNTSVQTVRHNTVKVGRNQPCPCGSGKKYKKCCGK